MSLDSTPSAPANPSSSLPPRRPFLLFPMSGTFPMDIFHVHGHSHVQLSGWVGPSQPSDLKSASPFRESFPDIVSDTAHHLKGSLSHRPLLFPSYYCLTFSQANLLIVTHHKCELRRSRALVHLIHCCVPRCLAHGWQPVEDIC